jgi:hypothetical protein
MADDATTTTATDNGMRNLNARLPVDVHDRLLQAAKERDVSMSKITERAVVKYLESLRPIEEVLP